MEIRQTEYFLAVVENQGVGGAAAALGISEPTVSQALRALEAQDARLAEVFCWRVFGGLDASEIAALRGVTLRTVNRDLALARAYLRHVLDGAA